MPTNYVLIDFENVQPKNLEILKVHKFKIFVFIGANQTKIPFEFASVLQEFGTDACYIKISGNGKNSLDFHIAYYLGQLSINDPKGYFHVISKDTGFDPLIEHLKSQKIQVDRVNNLAEIPIIGISSATSSNEKIAAIVKNLASRGTSRPRKVNTLTNTIKSLFANKLDETELSEIITQLQQEKYIIVNEENVTYQLPKES